MKDNNRAVCALSYIKLDLVFGSHRVVWSNILSCIISAFQIICHTDVLYRATPAISCWVREVQQRQQ